MTKTATYFIWTMGCQMNEADSRRLSGELEVLGYSRANDAGSADVIVLNTCVVRQQAENKINGRIGAMKPLKKKYPKRIIVVMGCFVGVDDRSDLYKDYPFVDLFMSPSETSPLIDMLLARQTEADERDARDEIMDSPFLLPAEDRGTTVTANVSVILGCSHKCSYCIIPLRRGKEVSRPGQDIVDEVTALAKQGVREVTLLGQIVDRYGRDFDYDYDLADLLEELHPIEGLYRIRMLTSHPNYMSEKLLETMARLPKVCPHIEVPIQAGSDRVLKSMRRGYTVDAYLKLVDRIRYHMPDAAIHCDIIVGFCGETVEQYDETYTLIKNSRFDKVHIAKYSPRPGTYSADTLVDDVNEDEKERRRKDLDDLQREILEEKNSRYMGQTLELLVESRHKGRWRGRTPQNRLVFFDDERDFTGNLVNVKITHCGPFSLVGSVVKDKIET